MDVPIIVSLLVALAAFLLVGEYAYSLQVDRSPEKVLGFVLPDGFTDTTGRYLMPVLFPLDLFVMVLLAGSTAWAAATWGPPAFGWHVLWFVALPLAYLAFDLVEDTLIALMLSHYIAAGSIRGLLPILTGAKIFALIAAWVMVVATGVVAYWRSA